MLDHLYEFVDRETNGVVFYLWLNFVEANAIALRNPHFIIRKFGGD
jgi:hypothetical protein